VAYNNKPSETESAGPVNPERRNKMKQFAVLVRLENSKVILGGGRKYSRLVRKMRNRDAVPNGPSFYGDHFADTAYLVKAESERKAANQVIRYCKSIGSPVSAVISVAETEPLPISFNISVEKKEPQEFQLVIDAPKSRKKQVRRG